jgi:DNA-binding MarR family transcriptional regulator
VTRVYDGHLREFGLEATQYALLSAMAAHAWTSQGALGAAMGLEKATVSRNLRLMEGKGWVRLKGGMGLTAEGRELLERAGVGWGAAQRELEGAMGGEDWGAMWRGVRALTVAAGGVLGV